MGGIGSNQYVTKPGGKLKGPRGLPDVTSLALETEWPEDSGWTDEAMDEYAAALEDTRKTRPVSFAESTRRNLSQALGSILDAFHPTSCIFPGAQEMGMWMEPPEYSRTGDEDDWQTLELFQQSLDNHQTTVGDCENLREHLDHYLPSPETRRKYRPSDWTWPERQVLNALSILDQAGITPTPGSQPTVAGSAQHGPSTGYITPKPVNVRTSLAGDSAQNFTGTGLGVKERG